MTSPSRVTVDGGGSQWINSGPLEVGISGAGTLNITGSALVQSTSGFVGLNEAGQGVVTVSGANSRWISSDFLFVGFSGEGVLDIGTNGLVQAADVIIGRLPGSIGDVFVDGSNARLVTTGFFSLGLQGTGVLNITAGGRVTNSAFARLGGSAGSTGTATVSGDGSLWAINDRLEIGGSGSTNGGIGTLRIQSGGTVSVAEDTVLFAGDQLILEGGTFGTSAISFNAGGGTFAWSSGTLHVGVFPITLTTPNDGVLAPGNSIGTTLILGNYVQRERGTLEIELAGPASVDFASTDGTALLSGDLQLKLLGGFIPNQSANFIIFDSRDIGGAFINVANGQRLTTVDGRGSFLVHYGPGSPFDDTQIVLSNFLSIGVHGDYNQNGIVDAADYTVWRDNLGSGTALPNDDTAGVGPDDYTRWKTHFGEPGGSGSGATGSASALAAIPEPATFALAALSSLSLVMTRRRFAHLVTLSDLPADPSGGGQK